MAHRGHKERVSPQPWLGRDEELSLRDHLSPAHSRALNGWSQLIHTDKELAVYSEQVRGQKTRLTMPMCAESVTCRVPSFMQVTLGLFSVQLCVGDCDLLTAGYA